MKVLLLLVVLGASAGPANAAQNARPGPAGQPSDRVAEAYAQFLLAHRFEDDNDVTGAIAAYKRAMALDPQSSDIVAELADLYFREHRSSEAMAAAEQALAIAPDNREAHRILGSIFAALAIADNPGGQQVQQENLARATRHLETALGRLTGQLPGDVNLRAMLARLYMSGSAYDKAIPLLLDLVRQEPGWQDGSDLLMRAYEAAGRGAEAIRWLEETAPDNPRLYSRLADFYGRERRWTDAAAAYEQALEASPRSFDLRVRYATMLLSAGGAGDAVKARGALREALAMRATDERAQYLLSQAERRSGDFDAAEATARRLIAQNGGNPRGFAALAEALEERQRYQAVVDALTPALQGFRAARDSANPLGLLLPHLGFAHHQLGQYDQAAAIYQEALKLAPRDAAMAGYLVQAHLGAKNYAAAVQSARAARAERPNDVRLARFEAQALQGMGRADEAVGLLEDLVRRNAGMPVAYVALAQVYVDASRGPQAVKVLQDAQTKFPSDDSITFELGAVFDKLKRHAEAEAAFRQMLERQPANAGVLNYLGYMLAERGERLDESIGYLQRALQIDPDNGSFLDSIGWAYFKAGKLDLAETNLRRAAEQLPTNSVVQDHYGDLLSRLGRHQDAITAWTRALDGDGDSIDRGDIDKKIRSSRQKLPRR